MFTAKSAWFLRKQICAKIQKINRRRYPPTHKESDVAQRKMNGRNGLNAREAYEAGKEQGYQAVVYGEFEKDMDRDDIRSEAFEIEGNARQYADHPSYEIHSDAAWESYDRGVNVGITQGLRKRFPAVRKPRKKATRKPNKKPALKRTKRACTARGKALKRTGSPVAASRLAKFCPPPGRRRPSRTRS